MKIKYLYQLLGSQISILIIAFLLLSLIFSYYVEELVYEDKVEELTSFGEKILEDIDYAPFNREQISVSQYSEILSARNTHLTIFDHQLRVVYPYFIRFPISDVTFSSQELNQLASGEILTVKRDVGRFGQAVSLVVHPYIVNGQFLGGVMLISPISGTREMISQINQYLLYTVLLSFTIAFILSWILSKVHVRRIKRIQDAASMIAKGNYHVQLPASHFDEIGELGNDFNNMANKLRASMEEIEMLENKRRQFIADVSHELRTPLTTISGLIEGMKNNMIDEENKEKSMQLISKETKRLIRLVNENLDYEKIRSNQVKLEKVSFPLLEALEMTREHLLMQAHDKKNEIIIEADDTIQVIADYDRLIQILINITKNSIQFTSEGTIWLRGKSNSNETIIEIEDTGIGMDPNEIESIWTRFYKADLSRKNNPYGEFGLGLSIVKQLVLLHHGKINVYSKTGKGTKFIIRLPR